MPASSRAVAPALASPARRRTGTRDFPARTGRPLLEGENVGDMVSLSVSGRRTRISRLRTGHLDYSGLLAVPRPAPVACAGYGRLKKSIWSTARRLLDLGPRAARGDEPDEPAGSASPALRAGLGRTRMLPAGSARGRLTAGSVATRTLSTEPGQILPARQVGDIAGRRPRRPSARRRVITPSSAPRGHPHTPTPAGDRASGGGNGRPARRNRDPQGEATRVSSDGPS